MNCWRWRRGVLWSRLERGRLPPVSQSPGKIARQLPALLPRIHGAILHAELFAVSGAGGHSWRAKKSGAAQAGFQSAKPGGIEARRCLEIRRGADLCDDAERAERARLPDIGTGKALSRAEGRRHSGRGLCGFRGGKRAEAGVEISARPRGADVFQGVFAVLPARRLFCRAPRPHRRAAQNPRQLQRERPRPDRRRSRRWAI